MNIAALPTMNRVICVPENRLLDRGYDMSLCRIDTNLAADTPVAALFEDRYRELSISWKVFSNGELVTMMKILTLVWLQPRVPYGDVAAQLENLPITLLETGQRVVDITLLAVHQSAQVVIGYRHPRSPRLEDRFEVDRLPVRH